MSKEIVVNTENGEVKVKKLPLRGYVDLFKAIQSMTQEVVQLFEQDDSVLKDNAKLISVLAPIAMQAPDRVADILALTSNKDNEFFLELGLDDVLEVLAAALEANNYQKVLDALKKVGAQVKKSTPKLAPMKPAPQA